MAPTALEDHLYLKASFDVSPAVIGSVWYDGEILLVGCPTDGLAYLYVKAPDGSWHARSPINEPWGYDVGYSVCNGGRRSGGTDITIGAPLADLGGTANGALVDYRGLYWQLGAPPNNAKQGYAVACSRSFEGSYVERQIIAGAPGEDAVYFYTRKWGTQRVAGGSGVGGKVAIGYQWAAAATGAGTVHIYKCEEAETRQWSITQTIILSPVANTEILDLVDDQYIVIGESGTGAGYVEVYERSGLIWALAQRLSGSAYNIGYQAIIDGDKLYISSRDPGAPTTTEVNIYDIKNSWALLGTIPSPTTSFGSYMSAEGGNLAIAATSTVYIYDWNQYADLGRIDVGAPSESMGNELATDGSTMVVCSDVEHDAWVYNLSDGHWTRTQKITEVTRVLTAAVSGDWMFLGVDNIGGPAGMIPYLNVAGTWTRQVPIVWPAVDEFATLTMQGTTLLAGGYSNPANVFQFDGLNWNRTDILDPAGRMGTNGLAIDGDIILIGDEERQWVTPLGATMRGVAYVYTYSGGTWNYLDSLLMDTHPVNTAGVRFGVYNAVAVNGDWLAVGTADTRIFMYKMEGGFPVFKQNLSCAFARFGVFWNLFMDSRRLYATTGGGHYAVRGNVGTWELDSTNDVWYLKQQLTSRNHYYYAVGATEVVAIDDQVFTGDIYWNYPGFVSDCGSVNLWEICTYSFRGKIQLHQAANVYYGRSTAACFPRLVGGCINSVEVLETNSGEWVTDAALSTVADDLETGGYPFNQTKETISPDVGETGFGLAVDVGTDHLLVVSGQKIHMYFDGGGGFAEQNKYMMSPPLDCSFTSTAAEYATSLKGKTVFMPETYTHGATVVLNGYDGAVYEPILGRIYFIPSAMAVELNWHYYDAMTTGNIVAYAHGATVLANGYSGGVYDPINERIYMVPSAQGPQATWHYINCATGAVVPYVHGATVVNDGYKGGTYDPINQRIYFTPYAQSAQANWHYINLTTGAVVAYAHGAVVVATAYYGSGAYEPINDRIYWAPANQSSQANWHYLDCATSTVVAYPNGLALAAWAYGAAVYDPILERVYFCPDGQDQLADWHYVSCATGNVVAYAHGTAPVANAFEGFVYSEVDERIYFVPDAQAPQANWFFIECSSGVVTSYVHGLTAVLSAYQGAAVDLINKRLYFSPYKQGPELDWHYIQLASDAEVRIFGRTLTTWSPIQTESSVYAWEALDADSDRIIVGSPTDNVVEIWLSTAGVWGLEDTLTGANDFGCSVSIYGNYALVGDKGAGGGDGAAYLYLNTAGTWNLINTLTRGNCTGFGTAVRIRDTVLTISCVTNDGALDCASIDIYELDISGSPVYVNTFLNFEGGSTSDHRSLSIDLNGIIAMGTPGTWDLWWPDTRPNTGKIFVVQKDEDVLVAPVPPPPPAYGSYSSGSAVSGGSGGTGSASHRKYRDITLWRPYKPG